MVETYIADRASLDAVDIDQLRALLAEGCVTLLDVRPTLEYRQGHIRGARSVPVDELERRLAELPHDCEVVAWRAAGLPVEAGVGANGAASNNSDQVTA